VASRALVVEKYGDKKRRQTALSIRVRYSSGRKHELIPLGVLEDRECPPDLGLRVVCKFDSLRFQDLRSGEHIIAAESHWLKPSNVILVPFGSEERQFGFRSGNAELDPTLVDERLIGEHLEC